jgi:hypothetical protein
VHVDAELCSLTERLVGKCHLVFISIESLERGGRQEMPHSLKRKRTVAIMLPLVLLSATACGSKRSTADATSSTGARPSPAASTPSATPAAEQCSVDPAPTNVATTNGTALTVSVVHQSGPSGDLNFAVPASAMNRYPELLTESLNFDGLDRAYDAGDAFSYGGGLIGLSVQNNTTGQVIITDVRPVNTRTVCLPSGLLVLYGSEGGDYIDIIFNLDAARPVAHEQTPTGEILTDPYFARHTIPIAPRDSAAIQMTLDAAKRAYTFDIDIDYLVNGKKYTQVVRPKNGSFKVTASACPDTDKRKELTDADAARLRRHRFQQIRQRTDKLTPDGGFTVAAVDPQAYIAQCSTW